MGYLRLVEQSERGLVFFDAAGNFRFISRETLWTAASVATFSDDGAAGALVYDGAQRSSTVDSIRNIVTANWADGSVTKRDASSITAFGPQLEALSVPTIASQEPASDLAAFVLRTKKDPATLVDRLTAPLRRPNGDNEAELLLGLEIGDLVTWERTPGGVGSQVVKTLLVQGIEHRIGLDQWTVGLYLSSAPTSAVDAPYLTLGDATFGKIGATNGNLIPF